MTTAEIQKRQIAVEREGCIVRLIWHRESEYDAMMLYDRLIEELRNGGTTITIAIKPREDSKL